MWKECLQKDRPARARLVIGITYYREVEGCDETCGMGSLEEHDERAAVVSNEPRQDRRISHVEEVDAIEMDRRSVEGAVGPDMVPERAIGVRRLHHDGVRRRPGGSAKTGCV
jgi:hypothetical protein